MNNNSVIYTEVEKECIICKTLTNKLDFCFEAYICSDNCLEICDGWVTKSELEGDDGNGYYGTGYHINVKQKI